MSRRRPPRQWPSAMIVAPDVDPRPIRRKATKRADHHRFQQPIFHRRSSLASLWIPPVDRGDRGCFAQDIDNYIEKWVEKWNACLSFADRRTDRGPAIPPGMPSRDVLAIAPIAVAAQSVSRLPWQLLATVFILATTPLWLAR